MIRAINRDGQDALHVAIARENLDAMRSLLAYKAAPSLKIGHENSLSAFEAAEKLLANSKCRKFMDRIQSESWNSVVIAADLGSVDRINALLDENEHDVNALNKERHTALHLAAFQGHSEAVRFLVLSKASPDGGDLNSSSLSPLHLAAQGGHEATVRALLAARCQICPPYVEKSPLDVAEGDACRHLLKTMGADGWTPLMIAAEKGGHLLRQYLKLKECCVCQRNKKLFPDWFQHEVFFLAKLQAAEKNWTLETSESCKPLVGLTAMQASKISSFPEYVYVFGNETFEPGVHTWEVLVEHVVSMWLGITKASAAEDLPPETFTKTKPEAFTKQNTLWFSSGGSAAWIGIRPTIHIVSNSEYSSGQFIELTLNTCNHSLSMKIDGQLAILASNIDDVDMRACFCMNAAESVKIVSRKSFIAAAISHTSLGISSEEWSVVFDNSKWTESEDRYLSSLIRVPGELLYKYPLCCKC